MKRGPAVILLVFVLFIAFIYWYFIFKAPCKPITQCSIAPINITCTSHNDCSFGQVNGICDMKAFKCVNLILRGNEEECSRAGGVWSEVGCGR